MYKSRHLIYIVTLTKELYFVDLVTIVNDQFNTNASSKTHLYKVHVYSWSYFIYYFFANTLFDIPFCYIVISLNLHHYKFKTSLY